MNTADTVQTSAQTTQQGTPAKGCPDARTPWFDLPLPVRDQAAFKALHALLADRERVGAFSREWEALAHAASRLVNVTTQPKPVRSGNKITERYLLAAQLSLHSALSLSEADGFNAEQASLIRQALNHVERVTTELDTDIRPANPIPQPEPEQRTLPKGSAAPIAQEVFDRAFFYCRPARSDAYKAGVLHCLRVRLDGAPHTPCPYPQGSEKFDAYHAGIAEGQALSPVGGAA